MYGCNSGIITYGWSDGDGENKISDDWLEKYDIEAYPIDLVRHHAVSFIYGAGCTLDKATGQASVSLEDKEKVKKAAMAARIPLDKLEFREAVYGDYELQHSIYTPGKNGEYVYKYEEEDGEEDDDEGDDSDEDDEDDDEEEEESE